jgi:hypothetical protein
MTTTAPTVDDNCHVSTPLRVCSSPRAPRGLPVSPELGMVCAAARPPPARGIVPLTGRCRRLARHVVLRLVGASCASTVTTSTMPTAYRSAPACGTGAEIQLCAVLDRLPGLD